MIFGKSLTLSMKKLRKSHKIRVRMRSPVRHHFGKFWGQFWLHFGRIWLPKSSRSASKAPQERSQRRFETLFGCLWGSLGTLLGALGPSWSAQGPPGDTPASVWDQFLKDFAWMWRSVRQKKQAFTTSLGLKILHSFPLQTPQDVVRT